MPDSTTTTTETRAPRGFPIVGIGASAGGVAALEQLFTSMPADSETGMAFVLVQHLSPDYKSCLVDLLKRWTRMTVRQVEDGMVVEPNCVYVIPPNRDLALLNGALQLLEPSVALRVRLPIDSFFRSLAQDQRERAICIVLSGTGHDGTLGARAVKGEGGLVVVQDPVTAEFDSMPKSAIATGVVDYVLPASEMPAQIVAYAAHAFVRGPAVASAPTSRAADTLRKIGVLLRDRTGHDFSLYKENTFLRRVERRMAIHRIERPEDYLRYAQQDEKEVEALFRDLLIGVTSFFRDPEAFEVLRTQAIPRLFEGKSAGGPIRVWVCGCSTGEEAYSIAILLQEHVETLKTAFPIQVFATDLDRLAIEQARAGVFPASIAADVSAERLARFFSLDPDNGVYRVQKAIRDMLIFSEQDVIRDPPFSRLDLISCRNLLIYMTGELQSRLIPLFHYALRPGGLLFLGNSETVGEFSTVFATLDRKSKLFLRLEDASDARRPDLSASRSPADETPRPRAPRNEGPGRDRHPLRDLTEQALLEHNHQAAVLVNGRGDILHILGRTGKYLEPAPGAGGMNVLAMSREGLRTELTAALRNAVARGESTGSRVLRVRTNGDFQSVRVAVRPLQAADRSGADLFVVILEEVQTSVPATEEKAAADGAAGSCPDAEARIVSLERDLQAKEEYLQATIEEMETSNEELKSTNEEMQSVNEELQSTNEELETSKEELQAVNEELTTVNAELQIKVADLSRASNDMNNLLAGTGVGTLFVDHQLRITRFTPSMSQFINLIQADIGRPVSHIVSNLVGYDRLVEDVRAVLDTLTTLELEVRTSGGGWHLMRIRPYRTLENVIEGVVLTFVDISERKRMEDDLRRLNEWLRLALDGGPAGFLVCDRGFRLVFAARQDVERLREAGRDGEDIFGQVLWEALPGLLGTAAEEALRQVMETRRPATCQLALAGYRYETLVQPTADGGIALLSTRMADRPREATEGTAPHRQEGPR